MTAANSESYAPGFAGLVRGGGTGLICKLKSAVTHDPRAPLNKLNLFSGGLSKRDSKYSNRAPMRLAAAVG